MKKIFFLLSLLFIIPLGVNAKTFTDNDTTYYLEKANFSCNLLDGSALVLGVDKDNNFVYVNNQENFFKVNNKTCSKMTTQEILDFLNNHITYEAYALDGFDLYLVQETISDTPYMLKTTDTIKDSNKRYFRKNANGGFEYVETPDFINDDIYEEVYIKYPDEAKFIDGKDYYIFDRMENTITKVEKEYLPDEYTLDYVLLASEDDALITKKVTTLDSNIFKDYLDNYHFNKAVESFDNIYLFFTNQTESIIVDLKGNKITDIEFNRTESFDNKLIAMIDSNNTFKLLNNQRKTIYEDGNLGFLKDIKYDNYTYYLINDDNLIDPYILYEYKVLDETKKTYEGKDVTFKFSGRLDRVSSIKLNDERIDNDNTKINLTSGSTVVTLKKEYINTLANGTYTLTVEYTDGVKLSTTIAKNNTFDFENPDTYDGIITSYIILGISLIGIVGLVLYLKRKKIKNS